MRNHVSLPQDRVQIKQLGKDLFYTCGTLVIL